jgi:hypothetical protein
LLHLEERGVGDFDREHTAKLCKAVLEIALPESGDAKEINHFVPPGPIIYGSALTST